MASLHHVELCTAQAGRLLTLFTTGLGFRRLGGRVTPRCFQWVVRSGQASFVITQRRNQVPPNIDPDPAFTHGEPWTHFCCNSSSHVRDSVFNVALHVRNVDRVTAKAARAGAPVLQPPVHVEDGDGSVCYSVIGSVCGNVVHTLVDRGRYRGTFLPQFFSDPAKVDWSCGGESVTADPGGGRGRPDSHSRDDAGRGARVHDSDYIDHVTLTCRRGQSGPLLDWYRRVFGMQRFKLNRLDSPSDGVRFDGEVGMALKAMEYWRCAETGLSAPKVSENDPTLKFVIAESLHDASHVETFNQQHGGVGVQHIGIHSEDIVSRVAEMSRRGVRFRRPPAAYYSAAGKGDEIAGAGITGDRLEEFRQLGLLIDSEADLELDTSTDRYLMQIFTEPLFSEDTFFLEVLERRGARGFGQGNIAALARSIVEEQRQRTAAGRQSG